MNLDHEDDLVRRVPTYISNSSSSILHEDGRKVVIGPVGETAGRKR